MATRAPGWVPAGAWLAPGYAEWQPPAPLRGAVACLWTSVVPDEAGAAGLILPDACSDLIWEQGAGCYVAGPDTGPARTVTKAGTVIVGVRFRPSAGGQVLGLPLSEIRDQRVPVADLLPAAGKRLPATLDPAEAAARALDVVGRLVADAVPDPEVARAAALLRDPATRTEDVADDVGLSVRQLRRRCHAAAGYGPKTLQRVLRFQRFVRMLDAAAPPPADMASATRADPAGPLPGPGGPLPGPAGPLPGPAGILPGPGGPLPGPLDLAWAAALAGYADQAHLTRECAALSGLTPAALARVRGRSPRAAGASGVLVVPR
jgi:AraC-like DNA-binding protein